ncbi:chemotaxis protein [Salinicola endophyticus]|uniref:Chemotaxis protein n=1 Tax=Salinicola endophyticus TaxID=1949083 RepID=A0ABY8FCZ2_9GAMM|nr:methyl-accepting chemotaxis protein [Salinicola endophyticus]WFF40667.1 chemotaxis protein [Salinicola endophyticus]
MSISVIPSTGIDARPGSSDSRTATRTWLSDLSLRRQRLLGVAILWLILAVMIGINALQSRAQLYAEREKRMITAVDIGVSTLAHYHQLAEQGQLSVQEAKRQAFNTLRDVRFGKNNYLFAFSGDLHMLAHPKRHVGEDLSRVRDPDGTPIFQAILDNTRPTGSGFTEYYSNFARDGDTKPKVRAYAAAFPAWDAYVASGVFVGDVNGAIMHQILKSVLVGIVAGALATLALWGMISLILRRLGGEPQYAAGLVKRIARGDLTAPITLRPNDQNSLLCDIRQMRDKLHEAMQEIHATSSAVDHSAGDIAASNQELSSRTEEQAAALQQTSSSMEEVTATVRQTADSVEQAKVLVSSASDTSQSGQKTIGDAVVSMQAISAEADKISDIVTLIDSIAFQTNILALNASVEAARAGEHGRGFAVVAGEVRQLANRSATAAKEIKGLIEASNAQVSNGAALVDAARQRMQDIDRSIQRVNDLFAEITAATHEQTRGIEQINVAIAQLDQATQDNASMVQQTAHSAHDLKQRSLSLNQVVGHFTLEA